MCTTADTRYWIQDHLDPNSPVHGPLEFNWAHTILIEYAVTAWGHPLSMGQVLVRSKLILELMDQHQAPHITIPFNPDHSITIWRHHQCAHCSTSQQQGSPGHFSSYSQ